MSPVLNIHRSILGQPALARAGGGCTRPEFRARRSGDPVAAHPRLPPRGDRRPSRTQHPGIHARSVDLPRHGQGRRPPRRRSRSGRAGRHLRRLRRRRRHVRGIARPVAPRPRARGTSLYPRPADGRLWPLGRGAGAAAPRGRAPDRHRRLRRHGLRGAGDGARRGCRRDRLRPSQMRRRTPRRLCRDQSEPARRDRGRGARASRGGGRGVRARRGADPHPARPRLFQGARRTTAARPARSRRAGDRCRCRRAERTQPRLRRPRG